MQSGDVVSKPRNERRKLRIWPRICVNASQHTENAGKNGGKRRGRTGRIHHAKQESIRQGKRTYEQKRLIRCQRIEEGSGPDQAQLRALDRKESALEVQAILLGKLAAEENHLKGLGGAAPSSYVPFERRLREVEEALRMLRYSWEAHSPRVN